MEWWLTLLLIFGSLAVLMATGMPIAFTFLLINLVGAFFLWGGTAGLHQLTFNVAESVSRFSFLPIVMFVLMGEIMFQSGMGFHIMDAMDKWLGRLPGRLGLVAVASGTLFATLSGSALASTAMLGRVLTPEMERRGYKKPMSIGPIMGSGGLAMIIPPSGIAVLLAALGEFSIGKLLMAGVIPGLVIASLYSSYIIGRCYLQPHIAPSYELPRISLSEKLIFTAKYVLPLSLIVFLVLGLIFLGISTPSEAAAMGVLGSVILAALYRNLNWSVIKKSIIGSLQISVMVLMIIAGAKAFSQILAYSGATRGLIAFTVGLPLPPLAILVSMQVTLLFLGAFMDLVSIMMITLPVYMPIIHTLGFDPVWFGLIMLINLEMAATTPPFGLLLFVMKGAAPPGTTMGEVIRAGLPFLLCDLTVMVLVMAFPILALWLPGMM